MPFREGNGNPLQYSCLENPMDGGAWWTVVHGVARGWTRLSDFTFTFYFHALEKEMATHSSVLAWRIPGMGEPGGLPSMGSHRVEHDWSDLAAAAAAVIVSVVVVLKICFVNCKLALTKGIAKNWTTKAFVICLYGDWTLCCYSCWASTTPEGAQGGVRHSVFQQIWWDKSLDSWMLLGTDFMISTLASPYI